MVSMGRAGRETEKYLQISVGEQDCTRTVLLHHLDYVDCTMTNAMSLSVVEVEVQMAAVDCLDHRLAHPRRLISTMTPWNHVHR